LAGFEFDLDLVGMIAKWALGLAGKYPIVCLFKPDSLAVGATECLRHLPTPVAVVAWDI
jgi:hypothetical protein